MTASPPSSPLRIALAGAGRVGTAVSLLLQRRGHEIAAVWSRRAASARRAAGVLGAPVRELSDVSRDADVVLIGVVQDAIEDVARSLGAGAIACHFAGAVGIRPLEAVVDAGGGACALHPVQACPDVETALTRLPGSAWGVTTSAALQTWAEELVERDLAGTPFRVAEGDRVLWHAAAVTTANGITALLSAGEAMLDAIGVSAPGEVLGPLAAGALANARDAGAAAPTLTGPIARGEVATVKAHLGALEERGPGLAASYLAAAKVVLLAAQRDGRVDTVDVDKIRTALGAEWR